ncbi:unnamed protein product [Closterium sp. Naga37s-1]|nr:unnamed protein product [Closterium sp. Naga37s-1]
MVHAGHGTNYGAAGEGAVDVQTQAFRTHQRSRKHKRSVKRQTLAEQAAEKQQRITDCPKARDIQRERVIALLETLLFICKCDAPIEMWVQLVRHLAERQTLGFPKNGYGAYYTREALAAKDAATTVPELGLIDTMLKELAEYLGRSHPSHNEFKELQEWDDDFYLIVTSVKFNVYLYYLADMLIILNNLNLEFQKREVSCPRLPSPAFPPRPSLPGLPSLAFPPRPSLPGTEPEVDMTSVQSTVRRTLITIRTRYIECGDDFGGGPQQHLGAFLARVSKSRKVTVDGVDKEGQPRKHSFELHEEKLTGYSKTPDDLESCLDVCRRHAKSTLTHLQKRLGDLESLNGVRLFMPDTYPEDKEGRAEECLEHFETLVDLFHARERAEILPESAIFCPCSVCV